MSDAEAAARRLLDSATPRRLGLPERGVEIALLDWGGSGPLALLHHANGFCKGTWGLVAERLRARFHVIAMDARGHGDSSHPEGPQAYAWENFAEDLVAVAEHLAAEHGGPVGLGIGHSFGGTTMIGASARRPALFERLLLVDPVIPPPPALHPLETSPHLRKLIEGAQRRRAHWPSRAAARQYCRERKLFADWQAIALELYLLDGMRELPDGGLELKCPGAVEAAVFAGSAGIDVFALARQVSVPTRLLWASDGDFPLSLYASIAGSMTDAAVEDVESGHLVPMERPELVLDAIARMLPAPL